MSRGIRGGVAEAVSIMIGCLASADMAADFKCITSASWKNRVNAVMDLKSFYKEIWAKPHRVAPHRLDSALMCLYVSDMNYGTTHIKDLKLKKNRVTLLRRLKDAGK